MARTHRIESLCIYQESTSVCCITRSFWADGMASPTLELWKPLLRTAAEKLGSCGTIDQSPNQATAMLETRCWKRCK